MMGLIYNDENSWNNEAYFYDIESGTIDGGIGDMTAAIMAIKAVTNRYLSNDAADDGICGEVGDSFIDEVSY